QAVWPGSLRPVGHEGHQLLRQISGWVIRLRRVEGMRRRDKTRLNAQILKRGERPGDVQAAGELDDGVAVGGLGATGQARAGGAGLVADAAAQRTEPG